MVNWWMDGGEDDTDDEELIDHTTQSLSQQHQPTPRTVRTLNQQLTSQTVHEKKGNKNHWYCSR